MSEIKKRLTKWLDGEEEEDNVFDYVIDLYTLYEFAPKTPNSGEDVEKLLKGIEMILDVFGFKIRHIIDVGGDITYAAITTLKHKINELNWDGCDLLLVKEYDMYVFCIE